ncbi:MAG: hypothetical protein NC043_07800 [Muribaculaceae bacterium]|nr:hypothetical protein [Muribaculaceae bacterium]
MNPLKIYLSELRQGRTPQLSAEQMEWIADRYPFFTLPIASCQRPADMTDEAYSRLMARVALGSADRDMLFRLTDADGKKFAHFYPDTDTDVTPTTDVAIDTFLDTYGHIDPKEEALLEKLIFNPVPADYASVLVKEDEAAAHPQAISEQDAMLDAFLNRNAEADTEAAAEAIAEPPVVAPEAEAEAAPEPKPVQPTAPTPAAVTPPRDSSLLESLSKIYIRQKRYDKAYEIIYQLSLNFPEKSIYFADQLRFLQKLILNRQYLNKTKNN